MLPHLQQILERAAKDAPSNGSFFYNNDDIEQPVHLTYSELLSLARFNAKHLSGAAKDRIILLHFNSHQDNIIWFWSVILAGGVPAISTPLAADATARLRHLKHLRNLLSRPTVLTSQKLAHEFAGVDGFVVVPIESLPERGISSPENVQLDALYIPSPAPYTLDPDLAFLMFTSGSSGNAKAVEERHSTVLAALHGKAREFDLSQSDVLMNWIGFDHVACVTEIYLLAVLTGANNIHISPSVVLQDPLMWIKLADKHSVSHAFAPNFFLGVLNKAIDEQPRLSIYDLSCLRHVVSGGEANVVLTGIQFNGKMNQMGAPETVLVPAFGMTETCGGCTYHRKFPSLEQAKSLRFCSVGKGTNAVRYRIVDGDGSIVENGTEGNLELRGACVFPSYFNDPINTMNSFTSEGKWFKTGDKAYIDASEALVLTGRVKDSIIINGVKYYSHELESALEEAIHEGLVPSYTAAIAIQPVDSDTEELVILFLPSEDAVFNDDVLAKTLEAINRTVLIHCSKRPTDIIPLSKAQLPKSALGKLSRAKLKKAYEAGSFYQPITQTKERMANNAASKRVPPKNELERTILDLFVAEFDLDVNQVGINTSLFDVNVDSLALVRFKACIQKQLGIADIPMTALLTNTTIMTLAAAVAELAAGEVGYRPVVVMQQGTSEVAPMWFFHPGPGEVLVFLGISQYFQDRQVYSIRAPGFSPNEVNFSSLNDMVDTYVAAIRQKQPNGPYVLLGYSLGGILAFEAAKQFEAMGETVQFCGILDLPPYPGKYLKDMSWSRLYLMLLCFIGLVTDEDEYALGQQCEHLSRDEAKRAILASIDMSKMQALDLEPDKLDLWVEITTSITSLVHDYNPQGSVDSLDVFYATPGYRMSLTKSKEEWLQEDVSKWNLFSRTPPRYHSSSGMHHTMLNAEHVFDFQKILRAAMLNRG